MGNHRIHAALVTALVIGVAGCNGSSTPVVDDAAHAAEAFLGELRAGKVEPAWNATSPEFKSLMGLDALRDLVKKTPALRGAAEFAETRAAGVGLTECVFRGSNAKPRGKPSPASVRVALSSGSEGWKVERLAVE